MSKIIKVVSFVQILCLVLSFCAGSVYGYGEYATVESTNDLPSGWVIESPDKNIVTNKTTYVIKDLNGSPTPDSTIQGLERPAQTLTSTASPTLTPTLAPTSTSKPISTPIQNLGSKVIYVGSSYEYKTIQEAINAAEEGDSIIIKSKYLKGVPQAYYENIEINKDNIKIGGEGADSTIIAGSNSGNTVTFLNVKNVKLSNLTIQGGINGVYFINSENNIVNECNIKGNMKSGVSFKGISQGNEIYMCNISQNGDSGIKLGESSQSGKNSIIRSCTITENIFGISCHRGDAWVDWPVVNVKILGNEIYNNLRNGIISYYDVNWTIEDNKIHSNGGFNFDSDGGISIQNVVETSITGIPPTPSISSIIGNDIYSNNGHGIFLNYTIVGSKYTIKSNRIEDNKICGMKLGSTSSNVISDNSIIKNKQGILCETESSYNFIYYNDFIDNIDLTDSKVKNAEDNGSKNIWDDREKLGNYWSDYSGIDSDDDGIGDINYEISGTSKSVDELPVMKSMTVYGRVFEGNNGEGDVNEKPTSGTVTTPTPTTNPSSKGDIIIDGNINSLDFATLRMYILGMQTLSKDQLNNADVNNDKEVNSIDFALLRKYLLGLINSF